MTMLVKIFSIVILPIFLLSCATSGAPPIQSREAPPSKRINIHEVENGDTIYSIAWRYEADYRDMARINGLYEPFELYRGQKIKIYDDGLPPPISYGSDRYAGSSNSTGVTGNAGAGVGGGARTAAVTVSSATVASGAESSVVVDTPVQVAKQVEQPVAKVSVPNIPNAGPRATEPPVPQPATIPAPRPAAPTPSVAKVESPKSGNTPPITFSDDVAEWQWPVKGRIIKSFGSDSLTKGIVMEPTSGEYVTSAADGVVVYAGDGMRGLGNLLIVKHSNLFLSAYAYNDQLLSKEGDRVHLGQQIAKIGSGADGDKRVYFEVRKDGKPVDPISYLPRR